MKKVYGVILILGMLWYAGSEVFAVETGIDGTLGTAYSTDPAKFGMDLSLQHNWVLDPFFVMGFESGLYWVQWSRKVGEDEVTQDVSGDLKADTNAFYIPIMVDAQVRLPNLKKRLHVTPYINIGLGYPVMIMHFSQPAYKDTGGDEYPEENKTKFFSGFAWQIVAGAGYKPSDQSKVEFLGEFGYRNAQLKNEDNIEIDMSGFMIRIGVRYPFGGSSAQ